MFVYSQLSYCCLSCSHVARSHSYRIVDCICSTSRAAPASDKKQQQTEEEVQANSLNQLSIVLNQTDELVRRSSQRAKESARSRTNLSPSSQQSPVKLLPKSARSYEDIFKEIQFGKRGEAAEKCHRVGVL